MQPKRFPSPKETRWQTPHEMDTRYKRAQDRYAQRDGEKVVRAHNWRRMAFIQAASNIVLIIACVFLATKASVIPFLVEVEAKGNARLVGKVTEQDWSLSKSVKQKAVHQWISNLRGISSDRQVMVSRFAYVRTHSTAAGNMQLTQYLKDKDPFTLIGEQMRTVHIEATTTIPGSDNAYRVQWREDVLDKSGVKTGQAFFIAEIHLSITPPKTEEALLVNPLGVYVSFFTITTNRAR